jgi:ABC-type uncharacterized transport system permease subunit
MSSVEPTVMPVGDTPSPAETASTSNRGASRRAMIEEAVLPPLVALLLAAVVGDALILSFGQSPGAVYRLLLDGTWGNSYGFGQVLYKATTLVFTGLAVGLGLRAGLFNIGAESQLAAGGFCAALVGLLLPAGIPSLLCLPIYIIAGALGGGVVGAVPGVLKARFGAHEVIVTIMLNFIVLALLNYLTSARLHVALAMSGAIAGIGGLNYVLGYKHYYEEGFATGAGFLGIAVALVGRSHPIGIGLAALLFATLSQGGLAVNALVPKQMVDVLQAVVILAVATSVPEVRRLLRMRRGGDR